MATIRSLQEAIGVLRRTPAVFAVGLLYAVIVLPQTTLSTLGIPFLPTLLQMVTFFITPFVIAGLVGMVYEGRHRDTDFGTFKKVGKARYLAMLLGNGIEFVITMFFVVIGFIVVVFTVGFSLAAAGGVSGDPSSSVLGGVGLLAIAVFGVLVLLFLLVMFFVQFYSASVVVDEAGPIAAYSNSIGVVRRNLVPSLGFSLINLLIGIVLALPAVVLVALPFVISGLDGGSSAAAMSGSDADLASSLLSQLAVVGYSFLVSVVMVPFRHAFSVAFYDIHGS